MYEQGESCLSVSCQLVGSQGTLFPLERTLLVATRGVGLGTVCARNHSADAVPVREDS